MLSAVKLAFRWVSANATRAIVGNRNCNAELSLGFVFVKLQGLLVVCSVKFCTVVESTLVL
jgi:hypothetical protein